jgi:hypothetical protein
MKLIVVTLLSCVLSASSTLKQTAVTDQTIFDVLEQPFPIKLGLRTVYGNVYDFAILGGASILGIAIQLIADIKFDTCLMDIAQLTNVSYSTYYFWDTWWVTQDESEIVKAIIYAIQSWRVGTNLRCLWF